MSGLKREEEHMKIKKQLQMKTITKRQLKEEIKRVMNEETNGWNTLKRLRDSVSSILLYARQSEENLPIIRKHEKIAYQLLDELENYI